MAPPVGFVSVVLVIFFCSVSVYIFDPGVFSWVFSFFRPRRVVSRWVGDSPASFVWSDVFLLGSLFAPNKEKISRPGWVPFFLVFRFFRPFGLGVLPSWFIR